MWGLHSDTSRRSCLGGRTRNVSWMSWHVHSRSSPERSVEMRSCARCLRCQWRCFMRISVDDRRVGRGASGQEACIAEHKGSTAARREEAAHRRQVGGMRCADKKGWIEHRRRKQNQNFCGGTGSVSGCFLVFVLIWRDEQVWWSGVVRGAVSAGAGICRW